MDAIKLTVWVGEDKKLVIDLPEDVPVGPADILLLPKEKTLPESIQAYPAEYSTAWIERREQMRERLMAAKAINKVRYAPEGYVALSDEMRMSLFKLPPGARPTDELIDEDRGPR